MNHFSAYAAAIQRRAWATVEKRKKRHTLAGGDASGAGLRSASYSPNTLNQYSQRDVPSAVDITGVAYATANVTVNSSDADYRQVEYFWEQLPISNSSGPAWTSVSVIASQSGSSVTNSGNVLSPPGTQTFAYDADGNLTNDLLWSLTWDPENRLATVESLTTVPSAGRRKLEFTYDYLGRRATKKSYTHDGNGYVLQQNLLFVHDGWRLLAELNATNLNVVRSYVWGQDLSGTLDGAGGIGGLAMVVDHTGASPAAYFSAYDGNGNIMAMVKSDGTLGASYEYGPFGEVIRATGPMAKANAFRFSTKYADDETDLIYYGYRHYSPSLGRWISRDPIEEEDSANLYAFVANNPVSLFDLLGASTGSAADTEAGSGGAAAIDSGGGSQASTFLRQVRQWADEFNEFQEFASDIMDVLDGGDDLLIAVLEASNQNAAKFRGGESAAARLGRAAHDLYNPGPDYNIKTKAWLNGGKLKPDAIDFVRGIVRELKPFTKRGIREGRHQVKKYLKYLNENFKREGGWKAFVDYY